MFEFDKILKQAKNLNLQTSSTTELQSELERRKAVINLPPLHVFNDSIKPYLNWCVAKQGYDIPPEYVVLTMLVAYSTAVGSAVTVSQNNKNHIYLPVWGCNVGISSSGKSLVQTLLLEPITQIQQIMDAEWKEQTKGLSFEQISRCRLQKITYRNSHIATFVKTILPDNPKGVLKLSDEIMEWINGMNQLSKKEGTDEQFWLTTWNCARYDNTQSNRQNFVIDRPFVSLLGGIQPSLEHRLFEKDRDTSGFVFRILFAKPDVDRIAEPNGEFEMPTELGNIHNAAIFTLHNTFKQMFEVEDTPTPIRCILSQQASNLYRAWTKTHVTRINRIEDSTDINIHAGVLGKIKEYALRFAALLKMADLAYQHINRNSSRQIMQIDASYTITSDELERALQLADFFFNSAIAVFEEVKQQIYAPKEVLVTAYLLRTGKSEREISKIIYPNLNANAARVKLNRNIKKWITQYPRVFNAKGR